MSRAAGEVKTWGVVRPWMRVLTIIFFWSTVAFLVLLLTTEREVTGTLIAACLNPLVVAGAWLNIRRRTEAHAHGLRIVDQLTSRRIAWSEVAAVTTPHTRWGEAWVQLELTDGTSLQPVGVPASAAADLEQLRTRALA